MIKSELPLNTPLLTVADSISTTHLKTAGLAWLDMAVELFAEEVFSELSLKWWRGLESEKSLLILSLDSSKNYHTKELLRRPGAPKDIYRRRERFDAAVAKLLTRTTPEHLWAALANSRLANVGAWDFAAGWERRYTPSPREKDYPVFMDGQDFWRALADVFSVKAHPWL